MTLFERVMRLMKWDEAKTLSWFSTMNPMLGATPHMMLLLGRGERLEKFIAEAEAESSGD
jgi:hypothetical protein